MAAAEPSCPALWRQGLRKTGISLVPKKPMVVQQLAPAGKVSPRETSPKEKPEDDKSKKSDESPASWRLGLRKTGSYGALAEITATKEAQKEKDTAGVMRSASSPRLSSTLDNKEKEKDQGTRLAYVAPNIPRRLASTSDIDEKENRDSAASLVRSGSYTRRRWDDDQKNSEGSASTNRTAPSYQRSTSHTLALGRSGSTRDVPAKSSSASSLDPNTCNTKPWQSPASLSPAYSIYRSGSFGRKQEDLGSTTSSPTTAVTTTSSVTSPTGHRSLGSSLGTSTRTGSSSITSRYWAGENVVKESAAVVPTNTGSTTTSATTVIGSDGRERRRSDMRTSYLTPVRDEESESQRKARSRQARQSRRSTQGVTLTDLKEAEKSISRSCPTRTREEEKEEKEKQDKEKQEEKKETGEPKEDDYRSRYRSFEETYQRYRPSSTSTSTTSTLSTSSSPSSSTSVTTSSSSYINRPNSLLGITSSSRSSRDTEKESDRRRLQEEEKEGEDKSQPRSIRDRRRPREKRRSTGVSFLTQDGSDDPEQSADSEDGSARDEPQSDRLSRDESNTSSSDRLIYSDGRRLYSSRLDRDDSTDYKKLYEQILAENEKLKAQLHDTDLELADLKLQLEKATQRQERFADRSQLEMEKRERRALERKISEMEEELKTLPDLKADNQRLKDENGALIRVISKLSK
ncbi:hypothetical protein UPYG_G00347120 [Umbra pygmaea]|uniref:cGMP-dependent protein kinase interacting domain-containing protein n=1 Tax=Umbra pygmaea TaxID=75934 RepID=A0ABD0WGT2_UMBPY